MASAYHMVHYRQYKPEKGKGSATLEQLCRKALDHKDGTLSLWERVTDRIFDVPDVPNRKIVLNRGADLSSAVFAEMCLLQNDGLQALLELTEDNVQTSNITTAQIYKLAERTAPRNSQFVRGMAYWLVLGNNLFFVKTQSMSAAYLNGYLDWLLKSSGGALPENATLSLQAEFDRSQFAGDIGEIRSFKVGGGAIPLAVQPDEAEKDTQTVAITDKVRETTRKILDRTALFEQAVPILNALLGQDKARSLLDSLGQDEYVAVDASVKVRGRRTEQSKLRMRELTNELADMTEGKVQVEGKDGKVSDDDAILRTRMPFTLPQEGSNFLDFDNVADQLQEVYSRFVKDGKIPS